LGATLKSIRTFVCSGRQTLYSRHETDRRIGNLRTKTNVPGQTFECAVPWQDLGYAEPPQEFNAQIRFERVGGLILQSPVDAKESITLTLGRKY